MRWNEQTWMPVGFNWHDQAAVVCVAMAMLLGLNTAESRATDVKLGEWLDVVRVSGDMRIRHEMFQKESPGAVDRNRQRARFRIGVESQLPNNLTLAFRFATGAGDQVSTNQSFDNLSEQKQVRFDQFFMKWSPKNTDEEVITLAAGRLQNNFWRIPTSDIVWDDDFNPEGFTQSAEWFLGRSMVFANVMEMVADEDEATKDDQWMVGGQIGTEMHVTGQSRIRIAMAFYEWVNEDSSPGAATTAFYNLGQVTALEGNRRAAGNSLLNEFGVAELTAEMSTWVRNRPLAFQGTVIENVRAKRTFSPRANKGWQAGARYGKADAARSWEMAYLYKRVETDATVADIADSDFGDGGTNRKGHIFWVAYNPWKWTQIKTKFFSTQVLNETLAPNADTIDRLQFDASVKF